VRLLRVCSVAWLLAFSRITAHTHKLHREKAGMTEEWYVPLVLPKPAKGEEEQKTPHQEQQA
jgi:hypothetical protein